ncbi:MAG: glycosyl hydrolase 108 family protein [Pseudomonadota bacterium]|nr:glycosyl hydrolase 108 family protein [Pseudomonadota bacterium]
MSERIEQIIDTLIETEGEYVNHPSDRGGPTRWGITEAVARSHGYEGDMRDFPVEMARSIYRHDYYEDPGFARVAAHSQRIAEELTDTGVNMGQGVAVKFLQRALNALNRQGEFYADMVVDGYIGSKTLGALYRYLQHRGQRGEQVLFGAINALQAERYIAIAENDPDQEDFVYGWLWHRVVNQVADHG